jgi:hypothetical protein
MISKEAIVKKHFGLIFSIMLALCTLVLGITTLTGWVEARTSWQEDRVGTPTIVSYQGMIMDGETPYNESGWFKFAIVETQDGTDYSWSNDGAFPPIASIQLKVENGHFSINLGDTLIPGMDELNFKAFDDPTTFLRVWFSPNSVTYSQLPDQPIASVPYAFQAEIAADSNEFDGRDSTAYQLKLTSSCVEGSAIRSISQSGIVTCEPFPGIATFSLTAPDAPVDDVGQDSAITIGTDGLPLISYRDTTHTNLKVAHCNDLNCTSASLALLDSVGDVGSYTSITIGGDGLGLIAYKDNSNLNLKVAHCRDITCSSADINTFSSAANDGSWTAITTGSDGFGLITHYDETNGNLNVLHCSNAACTTYESRALDSTDNVGMYSDIAIGNDNLALISYYNITSGDLKVAHCNDTACTGATITTLDSTNNVGKFTSITISGHGQGLISYYDDTNDDLKIARCSNTTTCAIAPLITVLDQAGDVGSYTSIATGVDGLGLISYIDNTNQDLKIAHCSNIDCTSATNSVLQTIGHNIEDTSIAIGSDGLGIISYYYTTFMNLMVAHCSNELCLPINWSH